MFCRDASVGSTANCTLFFLSLVLLAPLLRILPFTSPFLSCSSVCSKWTWNKAQSFLSTLVCRRTFSCHDLLLHSTSSQAINSSKPILFPTRYILQLIVIFPISLWESWINKSVNRHVYQKRRLRPENQKGSVEVAAQMPRVTPQVTRHKCHVTDIACF